MSFPQRLSGVFLALGMTFLFFVKVLAFWGNSCQKARDSKHLLTVVWDKMFYLCSSLFWSENLTCATAICRGGRRGMERSSYRMKNENLEKSLWRSESNAKEFCLKRPCVFLKTLRSFGTNALVFSSRTLKWRLLKTLFSISGGNRKIFKVTECCFVWLLICFFIDKISLLVSSVFSYVISYFFLIFLNSFSFVGYAQG